MTDGRIDPGIHELDAHLLFVGHGLSPFFAVATQFDEALDNHGTFEAADETWRLNHQEDKIKAWDGKLAAREQDSFDAFREFNIGIVADDEIRRKRINFQFRPALPNATHVDTGEPIRSLPDDLPEGIRVQVGSANVEPEETIEVLQSLAQFLGIRSTYFDPEHIHPWSRVTDLAVYVRLDRDRSEEHIVGREGLLERLAQFSSRRQGQGEFKWDNEEIVGHRTAVALNETALSKLYDGHQVGKLLKSYHMANPQAEADPTDPTTHPKLEVQYSTEYSITNASVPWSPEHADGDQPARGDVRQELETYLLNALSWAELPVTPDPDVYVPDAYWDVQARPDDAPPITLHPVPIEDVVERERDLATRALTGSEITDLQEQVLRALTDGGSQHYERVAERADASVSTVYRVAQKFDQLVTRVDGRLELTDDVVRDRLQDLFASVDRALDWVERGVSNLSREETVDIHPESALGKWLRRVGAVVNNARDGMEIVLEGRQLTHDELQRLLRHGYEAAYDTYGVSSRRFANADVYYYDRHGDRRHYGRVAVVQGGRLKIGGYVADG